MIYINMINVGGRVIIALLLTYSSSPCASQPDDLNLFDIDSKVITPTMMSQSLADSPAPVTIISRQQIKDYGVRSIPDALRFVPGMSVAFTSGNEYRINFHGTNGILPRRMQVMIDGMSIYRTTLSRIDWEAIPVGIDDIERIEVTRSPSGATYGTNSFFAVVNIITRTPEVNQVNMLEGYIGSQNNQEYYAKYALTNNESSFYLTARSTETDGFDKLNNPIFLGTSVEDGNDHLQQYQLHGRYQLAISDETELDSSLSLVDKTKGTIQQDSNGIFGTDETGLDIYARMGLQHIISDHHKLDFNFNYVSNENDNHFNACYEQLLLTPELRNLYLVNPQHAFTFEAGGTPIGTTVEEISLINDVLARISLMGAAAYEQTCGNISIDDKDTRIDLAIHQTYLFNDKLRMINRINISSIEFQSGYHLGGAIKNNRFSVSNNTEYKPTGNYTINFGILAEMEENYLDERIYWSPRLALNYHLNKNYTVRLSTTRSFRTPDLYERESDWQILVTDLSLPVLGSQDALHFLAVTGNPYLSPEEIRSTELSLYGNALRNTLNIDISVYHQELTDLISNGVSAIFAPHDNHGVVTLDGVDMGFIFKLSNDTTLDMGYAYQHSESNDTNEEILYAEHAGFLGIVQTISERLTVAIKYHAASNVTRGDYSRLEMTATNSFYKSLSTTIDGQLIAQYLQPEHVMIMSPVGEFDFSDENQLYFMAGISARF
jgi:iron complex outermembrane recepter protein